MQGRLRRQRRLIASVVVLLALAAGAHAGPSDPSIPHEDTTAIEAQIAAIERGPSDGEHVLAAAQDCENHLHDPARAAKLYERVLREWPDSRAAIFAGRRGEQLRAQLGPHDEFAAQAQAFAMLIAFADTQPERDVIARADSLSEGWPGAPDAALWLAAWECDRGDYDEAQRRYAALLRKWPSSPQGLAGAQAAASCALDAKDFALALRLARQLPGGEPVEDAARDALIHDAEQGLRRGTIGQAAWLAIALVAAVLLASLVEALRRGGWRWPRLRPPLEVMFFAPISAVLIAIAYGAQRTIAPAVAKISIAGVAFGWLSGLALDALRAKRQPTRARSILHACACALGVIAVAYLAIVHDGLLDMLIETAKYGPDQ